MIIVDIESTGLDPRKNAILSIGAVDFSNPDNTFYQEGRISKTDKVSDIALQINGFTKEQIYDPTKQTEYELVKNFFVWLGQFKDQTIAGQNVDLDKSFLNDKAKKYNLKNEIGKRIIDMHGLTYLRYIALGIPIPLKNNFSNINTDSILKFVGLAERPGTHNALEDAKLEAETFSRIVFGKNLLKEYRQYPIPKGIINK